MPAVDGFRDRFLRGLVLFGTVLFVITELLSVFHLIQRVPLLICWSSTIVIAGIVLRKSRPRFHFSRDPVMLLCSAGILAILALTAVAAGFSPPNSADAMAYHMPRVTYWAEASSVSFFPTAYFNQIMLQPLAEYAMLHTYVLSGGDHFVNFVQWFASLASIVAVSSVAKMLGSGARGQAIAALFCATLPCGILASSGAKNDYFMAMWLVGAVYFALRFKASGRFIDAAFLGAALGLALLTKATAYLFAPWLLAAILAGMLRVPVRRLWIGSLLAAACCLALNMPHYLRNYTLSGSIMGFDSAQGDGRFRWRNETFGWNQTVSNLLRNTSDQIGARSDRWNRDVYRVVASVHQSLGVDVNDPATTWPDSAFAPPKNANHEANAPNRWQLAILAIITCILLWRASRGRDLERAAYALGLLAGVIAFCSYLKWQPFLGRLFLPVFVAAAPLAGVIEINRRKYLVISALFPIALSLFLLDSSRHAVFDNWVRPLRGPRSVFQIPRDAQYFADMTQWNNQASYWKTIEILSASGCSTIGIDSSDFQLEYPLQALLRERKPELRFLHTGVQNASSRYRQPTDAAPCAVVCLECKEDAKRRELYRGFAHAVEIDGFVILTSSR